MKDEYSQRKQKFKDRSDFVALNSSFKVIKNSLDDVKAMIAELDESKSIRSKMHEYTKNLIEKEEYGNSISLYNRVKHQRNLREEAERYAQKKRALEDKLAMAGETNKRLKEEIEDLDCQARVLRTRKKMLLKENKLLTDTAVSVTGSILENQTDLINLLQENDNEELANLENLQTRFYKETVKMANLCEDIGRCNAGFRCNLGLV